MCKSAVYEESSKLTTQNEIAKPVLCFHFQHTAYTDQYCVFEKELTQSVEGEDDMSFVRSFSLPWMASVSQHIACQAHYNTLHQLIVQWNQVVDESLGYFASLVNTSQKIQLLDQQPSLGPLDAFCGLRDLYVGQILEHSEDRMSTLLSNLWAVLFTHESHILEIDWTIFRHKWKSWTAK